MENNTSATTMEDRVASLERTVGRLQSSLVSALDEVDATRKDLLLENAKLQQEFHTVVGLNAGRSDLYNEAPLRSRSQKSSAAGLGQSGPGSSFEYLVEQTRAFVSRTDEEFAALKAQLRQQAQESEARIDSQEALFSQLTTGLEQLAIVSLTPSSGLAATPSKGLGYMASQGSADPALAKSPFVTALHTAIKGVVQQQLKAPNSEVAAAVISKVEAIDDRASHMFRRVDDEFGDLRERVAATQLTMSEVDQRSSTVEDQMARMRSETDAARMEAAEHEKRLKDIVSEFDGFVRTFTEKEADAIRDAVLATIEKDGSTATWQRQLRDDNEMHKKHIMKLTGEVDRLDKEQQRCKDEQHQIVQAQQKLESSVAAVEGRVETELRNDFHRIEQQQKQAFSRQEQLVAADRHHFEVKWTSEFQKMQQKYFDEMQRGDQRRSDELSAIQQQLQDDVAAFHASQGAQWQRTSDELHETLTAVKNDVHEAIKKAQSTSADAAKRTQHVMEQDVRKLSAKLFEEIRKVNMSMDDNARRISALNTEERLQQQQGLDEELQRLEKLTEDAVVRLTSHVDSEVAKLISSSGNATMDQLAVVEERMMREHKGLHNEVVTTKTLNQQLGDELRRIARKLDPSVGAVARLEVRVAALASELGQSNEAIEQLHRQHMALEHSAAGAGGASANRAAVSTPFLPMSPSPNVTQGGTAQQQQQQQQRVLMYQGDSRSASAQQPGGSRPPSRSSQAAKSANREPLDAKASDRPTPTNDLERKPSGDPFTGVFETSP